MGQAPHQPTELRADRAIPRASPVAAVRMKIGVRRRAAKRQRALPASTTHDLVTIVSRCLPQKGSAVLAVSGGVDSMCLLDAAARAREALACELVVATFDHASGPHSGRAADFVARAASRYGLPVVIGRAREVVRSESAWREARWEFLRSVSE